MFKAIQKIVVEEQYHLLERLAEVIADKVLSYKKVDGVEVEVSKLYPSIKDSQIKRASIIIYRTNAP